MPNQKPVNLKWQTILCIIPFGWIFAYYEIQKLKMGVIIFAVTYGMSFVGSFVFPWPFSTIPMAVITLSIQIYYVRKWSREWNKKFE